MSELRNLIILFILLAIPSTGFCQGKDKSVNCSIPEEFVKVRPHPTGVPTELKIGNFFVDIQEISDKNQMFVHDSFLRVSWHDSRLSEQSLGRSIAACKLALDDIWHPDLLNVNLVKEDVYDEILDVDENGNVKFTQRARGGLQRSDFVFEDFPFDTQVLHIILLVYEQSEDEVTFVVDKGFTGISDVLSIEGWDIVLEDPVITTDILPLEENRIVNRIDFQLLAERQTGFYVWKMILPLCFIVLMAWCVFWVDPSLVASQIGLSTATVFTLIAFRFTSGFLLPPVAYFTRMDTFVFLATILVFIALGLAIATSRLASRERKGLALKIERSMRVIYLVLLACIMIYSFLL